MRTEEVNAVENTPREFFDSHLDPEVANRLKRDASGLVAAVVQQFDTGEVLMLGEHSLADGVEGFRFNADLVLKRFRWICWKGERVKAA